MKKLFFLPLIAVLALMSFTAFNYNVDTNASSVQWTGYKVTGKHTGGIKLKNGTLIFNNNVLSGGSFTLDMNSINCTDLEGEWAQKLVTHLKDDDFFGTAKYPTSSFVITRAIPTDSKGNYKVIGKLTIKNTTKEIRFPIQVTEANGLATATGKITVDRSDFDVRYGSGSFFDGLGDKTIYDDFDLQVKIVAKK